MKIDDIKINGFGKIKNKEIEFKDGINIIYGPNESGKSTILKFLQAILYGIQKTKNGKNISDFDKYKPWDDSEFSGKIKYTLDNHEKYEVFREFKKKNAIIYNEQNDDISKGFGIDKTKGINFFEEQVGIDETSFANTAIIGQQEVRLGKTETNDIVQKISNLVQTGDDSISFQKSIDKLAKMRNEQVGTDKTKQKPINIVESNLENLRKEKKNLMDYKNNVNDNSKEKARLEENLKCEQEKKGFLKELKQYFEEVKIKNAEIDFEKNLENECLQKVKEIEQKINEESDVKVVNNSGNKAKLLKFRLIFLIIFAVVCLVFVRNIIANILSCIPPVLIFILSKKMKNDEIKNLQKINQNFAKEYENAKLIYDTKRCEIENKEKNFHVQNKKTFKELVEKYKKTLGSKYIDEKMQIDGKDINSELENVEDKINQIIFKKHILEIEKENVDEKLEKLAKIEEQIEEQLEIKSELMSLDTSFGLAKECLESAYEEIKHNISPKFSQKLCNITESITNGKYKNIKLNDEIGLNIEVENGAYMPVDRLSAGTIDEMYLALRLSTLSEISTENMPIILDETFAYFDDERLKNVLCYLQDQNYDNQIIIFTCSKREEKALNELKIEYNLISLEK